jgi:hypothetical protein
LPEVFAERLSAMDGDAPVPIATGACEKVLIAGTDGGAAWPWPCTPAQAPDSCVRQGALCYANRTSAGTYMFAEAPRQAEFHRTADPGAWTSANKASLQGVLDRLGRRWRVESRGEITRLVNFVRDTGVIRVVAADNGRAVLLSNPKATPGLVSLQATEPLILERYSTEGTLTFEERRTLAPGPHVITLPVRSSLLLLLRDLPP